MDEQAFGGAELKQEERDATRRTIEGRAAAGDKPQTATIKPKSIILFSDGTGNSSAKLFKTNVWRMYEAVDLGPNESGGAVQIAYYDNGVGTQAIKLLAMLAGIFGFGLKRNILRLYCYVCRNYREGDSIYAFGFSRGAFTIRLVVALLLSEGVVRYKTEAELRARALDAFRRFSRTNNPNFVPAIGVVGRAVRDGWIWLKRLIVGPRLRKVPPPLPVKVRFVGVWDTVAAYGGPIAEITRGIDNLIWPLSMSDHRLDERVEVARHALALDDERDSFHPILWDELDWHAKAVLKHPGDEDSDANVRKAREAFRSRLQQVWFAGMHADVGGGYPDESLSFVSLCWMMAEAKAAGLRVVEGEDDHEFRLLPDLERRVHDMSNSLGPVHNSRAGFASYYRYQPRKIAAFLHPRSGMDFVQQTLILRDPVIGEKQQPPHGQLLSCKVHESVLARIVYGTDDYAPIVLPPKIEIVPYSRGSSASGGNPIVSPELKERLQKRDDGWAARQEKLWDWVWLRRILYFATTLTTVAFVFLPAWVHRLTWPKTADDRWIAERSAGWAEYSLPDWLGPWIRAFELSPLLFWGLLVLILIFRWLGSFAEGAIRSGSRRLWKLRIGGETLVAAEPSLLQRVRNSGVYQRTFQKVKWYDLPVIFGLGIMATILYLAAALATQGYLSWVERQICPISAEGQLRNVDDLDRFLFLPGQPCNHTGLRVLRNHRYEISFEVPRGGEWRDGSVDATPVGLRPGQLGGDGYLGVPFRRIIDARYLQPIYQIRPERIVEGYIPKVSQKRLDLVRDNTVPRGQPQPYRGHFTAAETGELILFANDSVLPGLICRFYSGQYGNAGSATVTIRDMDAPPRTRQQREEEPAPPASGTLICDDGTGGHAP